MHLRRYLVAGLLIWLPIGVTILVFKILLDLMDEVLFLVPAAYRPENLLGFHIPGLGAILALLLMFITGVLGANLLGKQLLRVFEFLLNRIPFVRSVYGGVKNFAAVVLRGTGIPFKRVLLIEYPRKGVYRIALQAPEEVREIRSATQRDLITAFVPTTPNAASGFIVFVPREDTIELPISVEDALKLIISLGVVVPPERAEPGTRPLAPSEGSS